jgi:hypothetical protein
MLADLEEGLIVPINLPAALMDVLDESNVDHILAALPARHRQFVLEWAHGAVFSPDHELIHLAGVSNLTDLRPEDMTHPREGESLAAFRAWFDRHQWPE